MKKREYQYGRLWLVAVLLTGIAVGYLGFALERGIAARRAGNVARHLPGSPSDLPTYSTPEAAPMDIVTANLRSAEGLPGVESLDSMMARAKLETWSDRVRNETSRHLYRFRQNPDEFNNSEAYFRMLTLVTVLQEDCGVRYNPERMQAPNFADSRDLFLHGLLTGKHQGTCVSMPVLYVAVGRKLGYPLKLVTSKAHVFARWDSPDGRERLNIEATSQGLNCFPDEYYHTWPVHLTPAEIASGQYLKSLTPDEELAVFLSVRGHCLEASKRLPEAQLAYAQAHQLAPASTQYLAFLAAAVRKEMPEWQQVRVDLGQAFVTTPTTRNP